MTTDLASVGVFDVGVFDVVVVVIVLPFSIKLVSFLRIKCH